MEGAIEAAGRRSGTRRFRTMEEKRQMVEDTLASGESVAIMARRYGVNANQLFHWRKLYQAGLLGTAPCETTKSDLQLLPVTVADESAHEQVRESISAGHPQGTINIEFPGRALVSVEGQVDTDIVRAVLESLRG
jgi:transposase